MNATMLAGLESLFAQAPEGVCVADDHGRILYANPAASRLLNLSGPGAPRRLCTLLCDRLAPAGPPPPSQSCPLLDPASGARRARFCGPYDGSARYTWNLDGELVVRETPRLLAVCRRLGSRGSDWEGLHFMRVSRA